MRTRAIVSRLTALAAAAIAATGAVASPAVAAPGGFSLIVSEAGGGCLTAPPVPAPVGVGRCDVHWSVDPTPPHIGYTITRQDTDNCLARTPLPEVDAVPCGPSNTQVWALHPLEGDRYQIKPAFQPDNCLTALPDGQAVVLRCTGDGNPSQVWRL